MTSNVVVMGVAGCGKSSVAALLAAALGVPLIEGDDFHDSASVDKMRRGVPLDDADREQWLQRLSQALGRQSGAVLTCSALKRAYRDRLRSADAALRFVYLDIGPELAAERVAARGSAHPFPATLVPSQFMALQPPNGEAGVLTLDASRPMEELAAQALRWLRPEGRP